MLVMSSFITCIRVVYVSLEEVTTFLPEETRKGRRNAMVLSRRLTMQIPRDNTGEVNVGLEGDPHRFRIRENRLVLARPPDASASSPTIVRKGAAEGDPDALVGASSSTKKKKRGGGEEEKMRMERELFSAGSGAGAAKGGGRASDDERGFKMPSPRKTISSPARLEAAGTAVKPQAPQRARVKAKGAPTVPRTSVSTVASPTAPLPVVGRKLMTSGVQHPSLTPDAEVSSPLATSLASVCKRVN
jgi:hypothetical protein